MCQDAIDRIIKCDILEEYFYVSRTIHTTWLERERKRYL